MFLKVLKNGFRKGGFFILVLALLVLPMTVSAGGGKPEKMSPMQKTMILNKPGVVFISTYYKVDLVVQASSGYPELAGKAYKTESGWIGSGFVIHPDGYILTNGHVINVPEKVLIWYVLAAAADQILKDVVRIEVQRSTGVAPSDAEIEPYIPQILAQVGGKEALLQALYEDYQAGRVKMDNIERNVYVQQGAFLSGKKIPLEKGLKADVRAFDFDGYTDAGEVKGKDIGILKVSASNMPTVLIGDSSKMKVGDKIYIIGYPGAPTFQEFLSKESQLEATMTSGIVSALKTMADGSQVIQTDAALTHGNSGGPAFNEDGDVIGIASMVAIEAGKQKYGFSYLRPSNVAQEFSKEKNIQNTQGLTDKAYQKGIDYYEAGKYRKAIREFETALKLYPNLTDAQEYIKKSQEALSSQGFFQRAVSALEEPWVIAVVAVAVVGAGVVVYLVIRKRRKKK